MSDANGWKRGLGAYSKNNAGLTTKQPFEQGAKRGEIGSRFGNEFTAAKGCDPWDEPTWTSGPVSRGPDAPTGRPRDGDFTTRPNMKAASATAGKFRKPGGSGQRSGA